jgi:RNA polymerase sigma-70 factor, ECF subfamily
MTSTLTSLTLIKKLQQPGNEQAWVRLCERYRPILLAVARRAGVPEDELDDLSQETLALLVEKFRRGEFDRAKGRLKSWLLGIAINKTREFRRKRRRQGRQVVEPGSATGFWERVPDERELVDIFEQEWRTTLLAEALREVRLQVDAATFEAFKLYAINGLAPADVAARLEMSRETVYNCKSRVLSRLRAIREELDEI